MLLLLRNKKEVSRWRVVSGRTFLTSLGSAPVDRIVIHGRYGGNDYDIAMVRLSSALSLGGEATPPHTHTHTQETQRVSVSVSVS